MMARKIRITWILLLLIPAVFLFAGETEGDSGRFQQVNREIVLLNLINGLHLNAGQRAALLERIQEAEEIRERFRREVNHQDGLFLPVLEEVRDILLSGKEIPHPLKQRVAEMKEKQHRLEDEMGSRLSRLEREIEEFLSPNQVLLIMDYKPCTIPPAQGKIGQDAEAAAGHLARLLTRVRNMHPSEYANVKEMILEKHLERIERHLHVLSPEEKAERRAHLEEVLNQIRTLPDQEFMVRRDLLAGEFLPEELPAQQLRKNELGKLGRFLLNRETARLLQAQADIL
jgi:hypothetical protein